MKRTNEELIEEYINGNSDVMDELYKANIGLTVSICGAAFEYCGSPKFIDYDDLKQEAALSFMMSASGFDKTKGIKFSTYIYECIFNHMINYISGLMHRAINGKVIYTKSLFSDDGNPDKEAYSETNIIFQDYWQKKLEICCISAEQVFFINYFNETIKNAVEILNPRQKKFMSFRYGLGTEDYQKPHTIVESSERFGITERDAYSIEKGALSVMRKYISEKLSGDISLEKQNNIYDYIFKSPKIEPTEIEDYDKNTAYETITDNLDFDYWSECNNNLKS